MPTRHRRAQAVEVAPRAAKRLSVGNSTVASATLNMPWGSM